MKLLIRKINLKTVSDSFLNFLLSICFALISTLIIKANVIPALLISKDFYGNNLFLEILIFLFYFLIFLFLYFLFQKIFQLLISVTKHLWSKLKITSIDGKSSKLLFLSLMTISLGVILIFIFTNIIARIDTKERHLNGLDIIPVIDPVGNDFQVGLYEPALNLWESKFKSISPDGTYPSIYPPLVNVFSLPFLLFDAPTAYLINIAILILCNFVSLIIAVKMIKNLFFDKVLQDKLVSILLSFILFTGICIYNFSSYGFLFSIERGNVDAIAMFFAMLSLWFLYRYPKKIWLQVILLSIATHIKIYPAALFLVLFYFHGKKLILPMLTVNFAFLFISGPKIAWSFLQSVTSAGGGAGVGNNWSWIGNHAAYSFATMLTKRYPRFNNSFLDLWLVSMLVPFAIWIQGYIRIARNKYSNMNSILILMISIPLMVVLPTISHDYRLIILSISLLLFIGNIIYQILKNPGWEYFFELLFTIIIMFFIARPYDMSPDYAYGLKTTSSFYLNNKYVWVVALEGIMVWNIIKHHHNEEPQK